MPSRSRDVSSRRRARAISSLPAQRAQRAVAISVQMSRGGYTMGRWWVQECMLHMK